MINGDRYHGEAITLARLAKEHYVNPHNNLVYETPVGLRHNWSSFGAHAYMAYAFLTLSKVTGKEWCRHIGIRIARKLVELQGSEGQWGWMYSMQRGIVVDFYPIFSVHQYAYAPLFLTAALDFGYDEFYKPLVKGFRWIFGENEIGESMVSREHCIVWRNLIRKPPNPKLLKIARGGFINYLGLKARLERSETLQINRECWSFEMALPFLVFCGRNDFDEVLNHESFK